MTTTISSFMQKYSFCDRSLVAIPQNTRFNLLKDEDSEIFVEVLQNKEVKQPEV